jgi:hypothetical protein
MSNAFKIVIVVIGLMVSVILLLGAYSHRIAPAGIDQCQQDITHKGHISDLPAFHCMGHSEWDMDKNDWDHAHPWMTDEWLSDHTMNDSRPGH